MRHRNTKERKQERCEFIYRHRHEIAKFYARLSWSYFVPPDTKLWIDSVVRSEIGYNEKTLSGTIWRTLAIEFIYMCERGTIIDIDTTNFRKP